MELTKNKVTKGTHTAAPIMWICGALGALCLIAHVVVPTVWGVQPNLNEVGYTLLGIAGASGFSMAVSNR